MYCEAMPWLLLILISGCAQANSTTGPFDDTSPEESPPSLLICRGNEPFWNVQIRPEGTTFSTPETQGPVPVDGALSPAPEGAWLLEGLSPEGTVRLLVEAAECLDTMADHVPPAPYRGTLELQDGRMGSGCCWTEPPPREGEAPQPMILASNRTFEDWSLYLEELLPAIQSCLARTPGADAHVAKAWPMNRGKVGVRTFNASGGRYHCVAAAEGGDTGEIEALEPAEPRLPGESVVVFTDGSEPPPTGHCYQHERAVNSTGREIGWLSYDTC